DGGDHPGGDGEVEVVDDQAFAVAEAEVFGDQSRFGDGRGRVGVGHAETFRLERTSRYSRNGPPSAEVTRPTGRGTGRMVRAMRSAPTTNRAPVSAEAMMGGPAEPTRRNAICGAASATKPMGPAAAV